MTRFLLTAVALAITAVADAQQPNHTCGFDHWMRAQAAHQPTRAEAMAAAHRHILSRMEERASGSQTIYTIPVVVHVVWNTTSQNVPDSVIHSQIAVLNEDYRRLNVDAALTREEFLPVAADAQIEFALATLDPDGNATSGIVRTETTVEGWELDIFSAENTLDFVKSSAQGGSDAWDTEHYLNVWVCNITPTLFGQIFGLAYPPEGAPNWPAGSAEPSAEVSGVIVHYTTLGRNNPAADEDGVVGNDRGRTLTHEIGHYLGLRHIWGDGFFNGCTVDDGLSDTPNCASADNYLCNHEANTCTDTPIDFNDMIENYMDYSLETCQNIFTQQQADMMRLVLETFRPGLIEGQVAVTEPEQYEAVIFYPNPTSGLVNILSAPVGTALTVRDATGRVIHANTATGTQMHLDLGPLTAGYYTVTLGTLSHTLIKY